MASPDLAPARSRWGALATLVLLLAAAAGAARLLAVEARPCWGDLVAIDDAGSPEPTSLQMAGTTGTPRSRGLVALGSYELHYTPVYHGSHDEMEIGWTRLRVVDPTACSRAGLPLSLGEREGTSVAPLSLVHDTRRDVYLVRTGKTFIGGFVRRANPGVVRPWGAFFVAMVAIVAAATALFVGWRRARGGGRILVISALLSTLVIFFMLLR